jgi:hypothetical protein
LLKLSILCTKFQSNYSNSIGRSSENIWSSSGAAVEALKIKGMRGRKLSLPPKLVEKLV